MQIAPPHPALVERFRADLERLTGIAPARLALAVSGGPDSLALLLLAAAAYPGGIAAATVDHGLRPGSGGEADFVADVCARLCVPHTRLEPDWEAAPSANVQAEARFARYSALCSWAAEADADIVTAHHLDDQAETLLMRLARGAGLAGLSGIRPATSFAGRDEHGRILRPLLQWRKAELQEVVTAAGLDAVRDPSNDSEAFDRTAARRLLAHAPWLAPERLAASTAALAECEDALGWMTEELFCARVHETDGRMTVDPMGLPQEVRRRLLLRVLSCFTDEKAIRGPKLIRLLDSLLMGEPGTLAGCQVRPDVHGIWHVSPAPPRRDTER